MVIKMSLSTSKKSKKRKNASHEKLEKSPKKRSKQNSSEEDISEESQEDDLGTLEDQRVVPVSHATTVCVKGESVDTWSKEDYDQLIKQMEKQIPKDDKSSFNIRAEKIDWQQVQFGAHTAEECHEKWKFLKGKVRHYRLLGEVLTDLKCWIQNPYTSSVNKKKGKHPDQPTRPLSSFMLYFMDKKDKAMSKNPNLKWTDISIILGKKFKALPEEKKAYYKEKASLLQEQYKEKLSKFHEKHPELIPVLTKKSSVKPTNKPLTPFKMFLREKTKKHQQDEDFNLHELTDKYKEIWKNLSAKKKAFWIRLAKEEEEKFWEQHQEEPLDDDDDKSAVPYKSVITKDENAILEKLSGKPVKPPNSAYNLFSRLMLQKKDENFDGEPKNRMKEIAQKWRETSDAEKKAYADEVKQMQETYKLEFANYLESLPEDKKNEELAKVITKKTAKQRPLTKKAGGSTSKKEHLFKDEPEKPPVTAWDLFKNKFIKKNSHLSTTMAFNQAASEWKKLSAKEIEKYKKKHESLKAKYLADYAEFLQSLTPEQLKEYSAMKNSISQRNEVSLEEESNSEEEQDGSNSSNNSSEESDSGVSEED